MFTVELNKTVKLFKKCLPVSDVYLISGGWLQLYTRFRKEYIRTHFHIYGSTVLKCLHCTKTFNLIVNICGWLNIRAILCLLAIKYL